MRRVAALLILLTACGGTPTTGSPARAVAGSSGAAGTAEGAAAGKPKPKVAGPTLFAAPLVGAATKANTDDCPRYDKPFKQPIAVQDDGGIVRHPNLIGFPIPFSRAANVRSVTGFFATTRGGESIPIQLEVLSRWSGAPGDCKAPIRWAYGWVRAKLEPKSRGYLFVQHDPSKAPAPMPAITFGEQDGVLGLDTGVARFSIRKTAFTGLEAVMVKNGDAWVTVAKAGEAGGFWVDRKGQRWSPRFGAVDRFEVERAGPLLATVAVSGRYQTEGGNAGFRYTVRLRFHVGSATVDVDHTYYNGTVDNDSPDGAQNRTLTDRVYYRLPTMLGDDVEVTARALAEVHTLEPSSLVRVVQDKRTPVRTKVVFGVTHGEKPLEVGVFAERPMIAARGKAGWALATIGYMGPRDPQSISYDPRSGALDVDWQSEELFVGGARGVWSKAVLDFGVDQTPLAERGTQAVLHAERRLIGAPDPRYLNTTRARTLIPTRPQKGALGRFDDDVDRMHDGTRRYLREMRVTGTQIWPDLTRKACTLDGNCADYAEGYFEGGDCNYWDWSQVELEAFIRTADPVFVHDFALGEAITMAETVSWRPDWEFAKTMNFGGLSPCYGGGSGWEGPWKEGLNHRRACPGDYSYNKVHKTAYVLSADRRFVDFFDAGAYSATFNYGVKPDAKTGKWQELTAGRMIYQFLEQLTNGAEFVRDPTKNAKYAKATVAYFDFLAQNSLHRGHVCTLHGTGFADPRRLEECESEQAWMLPLLIEWVDRVANLYDHAPAKKWLVDHYRLTPKLFGEVDVDGHPTSMNAFRTIYGCKTGKGGIEDKTCRQVTEIEAGGRFYAPGLVAYLNTFGLILGAADGDPLGICEWLPGAYAAALGGMSVADKNDYVWGKLPGQAYAFTHVTLAALERCK